MLEYSVIMSKNKNLFLFFYIFLLIFFSNFIFANSVFATPVLSSFLLNDSAQDVTFNPENGEKVDIGIKMSEPVKFTRVYICLMSQICNGSSGNYTRYFSPNITSDSVIETWDGKGVGDKDIVSNGEYKVVISFTQGTDTSLSLTMTHSIFVDSSSQNNSTTTSGSESGDLNLDTSTTTNTSDTSNQNNQITKVITRTVYISAHSGTENLSDYNQKTAFEISAGRERMASVGSPIEFNAKYTLMQNNQCLPNFKWSFGDGFLAVGKNITHVYKYPGDYQIILNGTCGDYNSISRTTVKVISPNVSISNLSNGDIEIFNNGKTEINIGDWKITPTSKVGAPTGASEKQKDFIFPEDTIISAGKGIILSKEDLNGGSFSEKLSLNNPSGKTVALVDLQSFQNTATSSQIAIREDLSSTTTIKNNPNISVTVAKILPEENKIASVLPVQNKSQIDKKEKDSIPTNDLGKNSPNNSNSQNLTQVASALDSTSFSSNKGFWSKLINVPVNGVKSFLRIFYDF